MIYHAAASSDLATYYAVYLGTCLLLIVSLGWILHRAGAVLLGDAFVGKLQLVTAIGNLLDLGFYLVSVGYLALSWQTNWRIDNLETVARIVSTKLGGLLLLLGALHLFNLLLLAIFRRRGITEARQSS
jgi:hypothetical protein